MTTEDSFKIPTSDNANSIFLLQRENEKLTITSVNGNAANGGMFFWGEMPEQNMAMIMDENICYD